MWPNGTVLLWLFIISAPTNFSQAFNEQEFPHFLRTNCTKVMVMGEAAKQRAPEPPLLPLLARIIHELTSLS